MKLSTNTKAFAKAGLGVVSLAYIVKFITPVIKAYHTTDVRDFLAFLAIWVGFLVCSALIGLVGGCLIGLMVDGLTLPGTVLIGTALSIAFARDHVGTALLILGLIILARTLMPILNVITNWFRALGPRLRRSTPRAPPP